jgi:hypothetical protein
MMRFPNREAGMGESKEMKAAIGSAAPSGWTPLAAYAVELIVEQAGSADPKFSYAHPLFGEPGADLDLRVAQDCMILLETDAANGLAWSLDADALTFKDGADAAYYFGLKYLDRGIAYERSQFPAGRKCTQVCFGARLNVDRPEHDRHPFSLNVLLERNGSTIPILIDPDIKNPSA